MQANVERRGPVARKTDLDGHLPKSERKLRCLGRDGPDSQRRHVNSGTKTARVEKKGAHTLRESALSYIGQQKKQVSR